MKIRFVFLLIFCFVSLHVRGHWGNDEKKKWISERISISRSNHYQYLGNYYKGSSVFSILNKAWCLSFAPLTYKGFKVFADINYEYFWVYGKYFPSVSTHLPVQTHKGIHFINYCSAGAGISKEIRVKNSKGKEFEFIVGAGLERYLFKSAYFTNSNIFPVKVEKPFSGSNTFYNQYFFRDFYGLRVYQHEQFKIHLLLSGVILRNERMYYAPANHYFHNVMLGVNLAFK